MVQRGRWAGRRAAPAACHATMERFVAVVKQYPGQQQVDLAVEIEVPGSWFGAGPMGSLTATEQREKYKAQAVEYAEVHEFPGATKGARKTREKAIRFICITDATAEPNSEGYWPYQHEVALPRPADPQRLRLPALQLQVRLASPDARGNCRCLHETLW